MAPGNCTLVAFVPFKPLSYLLFLIQLPNQFELIPFELPGAGRNIASPSSLPHCVRFYPKHSGTSGMFISKLRKNPK